MSPYEIGIIVVGALVGSVGLTRLGTLVGSVGLTKVGAVVELEDSVSDVSLEP